jgi:hypothetical protein
LLRAKIAGSKIMTKRTIKIEKDARALPRFTEWWSPLNNMFWNKPEHWPVDTPDYIFLARAFNQIGKAMFGEYWLGHEHLAKADLNNDPGLIARRAAAMEEIARRLRDGDLVAGTRPIEGGTITDAPRAWWNTEANRITTRFINCEINPKHPFSGPALSAINSWIFIKRSTLDDLRGPRKIDVAGNRGHVWGEQHRIKTRTKRNHWRVNSGPLTISGNYSRSPYIKSPKTGVMTVPPGCASLAFGPTDDAPMGMTIVEKIMARASGAERVKPGDLIVVSVDTVVLYDGNFFPAYWRDLASVKNSDGIVVVFDHRVPAPDRTCAKAHDVGRKFVEKFGIKRFHLLHSATPGDLHRPGLEP